MMDGVSVWNEITFGGWKTYVERERQNDSLQVAVVGGKEEDGSDGKREKNWIGMSQV